MDGNKRVILRALGLAIIGLLIFIGSVSVVANGIPSAPVAVWVN